MTARLADILTEVQTNIDVAITGVKYRIGNRYIAEHAPNPRIVWVPGKDKYQAVGRVGGNPRPVRTRQAEVMAYVFGDTLETAEDLVHAMVYAVHAAAHGSYDIDSGDWYKSSDLERGECCIVRLMFDIPITAPTLPTVQPAMSFDTSSSAQGDGYLDAGET